MKNVAFAALGLGIALSGCGGERAASTPSLTSGVFSQATMEYADGCRMPTPFNGTTSLLIDVHSLSATSLVAHLPGSSLRYEIDGATLTSPNVFQPGSLDYRDAGVGACDGISRAYDCVLRDDSDTTLSGIITAEDKVSFSNKFRFTAIGTECDAVTNSSSRFAGASFPCETSVLATYEK